MNYTLIIRTPPTDVGNAITSLRFAQALATTEHRIHSLFFYGDGVWLASNALVTPQNETDIVAHWREFVVQQDLRPGVCIATAIRRGVLDDREARRYERTAVTLSAPFELTGLGQLVEAVATSDRVMTFC